MKRLLGAMFLVLAPLSANAESWKMVEPLDKFVRFRGICLQLSEKPATFQCALNDALLNVGLYTGFEVILKITAPDQNKRSTISELDEFVSSDPDGDMRHIGIDSSVTILEKTQRISVERHAEYVFLVRTSDVMLSVRSIEKEVVNVGKNTGLLVSLDVSIEELEAMRRSFRERYMQKKTLMFE